MVDACNSINKMVGRMIIDVRSFLPPIPIFCCFVFIGHGAEYFMRLELQCAIPTLIFAERNCHDTIISNFVRWTCRLANIEPDNITIKLVHEFQEIRFSVEQVRSWFKYLISGLYWIVRICLHFSRRPIDQRNSQLKRKQNAIRNAMIY